MDKDRESWLVVVGLAPSFTGELSAEFEEGLEGGFEERLEGGRLPNERGDEGPDELGDEGEGYEEYQVQAVQVAVHGLSCDGAHTGCDAVGGEEGFVEVFEEGGLKFVGMILRCVASFSRPCRVSLVSPCSLIMLMYSTLSHFAM